ncbi:MAG TPA: 50S ribosomal protein L25 [Candidatus Angelobacter sp.]|nr:50S ribosomal protein L25 [Candidatus Angelobacter sp.]
MISQEVVEATLREETSRGKNEARRLRVSGRVPGVVYGAKKASLAVSVDPRQINRILASESGHNTIFDLNVGSENAKVMIVDWQYEPIKGKLLHIDLKRIAMDQKIQVSVPINLTGEAAGVKQEGGILDQVLREVAIECLPADIPSHIDADVTELTFGKVLRVSDFNQFDGKVKYITDANQAVAHITSVKEEVVATPEAVATDAAAVPAEPEVIKKGKQETEGEEVAEAKPEGKKSEGKK